MNQQMIFKMGRLFHEPILPFLKCEKWSESSLCSFTSLALMFKTFSTFWAGSCGPSPLAPNSRAFLVYEIIVISIEITFMWTSSNIPIVASRYILEKPEPKMPNPYHVIRIRIQYFKKIMDPDSSQTIPARDPATKIRGTGFNRYPVLRIRIYSGSGIQKMSIWLRIRILGGLKKKNCTKKISTYSFKMT